MIKLKTKRIGHKWWIVGYDEPVGPYDTKAEADESRRGLDDFNRHQDEPGFMTSNRLRAGEDDW